METEGEFDRLFCDLLPRLYRRAVLLVGEAWAEDAVHEAYLKLRRRPKRLMEHPEPYAYAFAAMTSVVRDHWRAGRRQVLVPQPAEPPGNDGGIAAREGLLDAGRLLAMLPTRQAAAVLLVDLDGYTIDEAAEILGVHRGTISRGRARALEKLRGQVERRAVG